MGVITLTTDFGLDDPFVGMMKGVICRISPKAVIVDLTHQVPSFDIPVAAWMLKDSWRFFPEGSIHVAVVDPGVGSARKPILVEWRGHRFVGPDNGIFSFFLDEGAVYHLTEPRYFLPEIEATFHGRDIFAPVAAHLSTGIAAGEMGQLTTDAVRLDLTLPSEDGGRVRGEVVYLDKFGNAITNLEMPRSAREIVMGSRALPIVDCYSRCERGEAAAVRGSTGRIEIFANRGNAAALLGIRRGDEVMVERDGE
ncbi:MAG: SAM-dependent chlorinase/fluorinase [Nitrospirota bacterium]|nr:SAM-dependent chlorinase/fluorinase [Nitrospirota bacterium]